MGNLHPLWTQRINFTNISQFFFLQWMFSIWISWVNSDPTLIFTHYLAHILFFTVCIFMSDVSVIWVVHHSKVGWHILIISIVLSPLMLWNLKWVLGTRRLISTWLSINIGVYMLVLVIVLLIL